MTAPIEFTVLLDNSTLEFEPARNEPDLAFVLPPTARIGRFTEDQDVVHLAPIPIHCFFNAMTFGHWLEGKHLISENDAFIAYCAHDMFKGFLHLKLKPRSKQPDRTVWDHQFHQMFRNIEKSLHTQTILDDFDKSFWIIKDHGPGGAAWKEATSHEAQIEAGTEQRGRKWEWNWPMIGLTVRLQSALSNALSVNYIKQFFIESYVEAIRAEYPDVFARFDAISYEYDFVDPETLTGNVDDDIESLCRQSKVYLDGRRLVIRSFIGAHGPHWHPGQTTRIRLPFWLMLTLRSDPVSVLFPVPTLYGSDGQPADNPAFVDRVRHGFDQRVRDLLTSVKVNQTKRAKWSARVTEIMAAIDDILHIVHTTEFDNAISARRVNRRLATETCSMCGSSVPATFTCSPVVDLGANVSNYTDWHLGDAGQACVLCAISHFKTPDALEPAKKLIFQRKLVYFAISTPSAKESTTGPAHWPFLTVTGFDPTLEIRSLESLVTLNIIGVLYLHNALRRAVHYRNGEPDLWLQETFFTGPYSFIGEVARARNKAGLPTFLAELFGSLNRSITLLDPLLPMQIEVPFHALACLWGVSKGRHYQFKFKPLIVSNETATLPIVWEGYHFFDRQTLVAIETLKTFVETFRHPKVSHRLKLTTLASSPAEFVETLVELGGFNYETVLQRLSQLSDDSDVEGYLKRLRELIVQTPLIIEMWE